MARFTNLRGRPSLRGVNPATLGLRWEATAPHRFHEKAVNGKLKFTSQILLGTGLGGVWGGCARGLPPPPLGDGRGEVPGGDLGGSTMWSSWQQLGGVWGGSPTTWRVDRALTRK